MSRKKFILYSLVGFSFVFSGGFLQGVKTEQARHAKLIQTIKDLTKGTEYFCKKDYNGKPCQDGMRSIGSVLIEVGGSNG